MCTNLSLKKPDVLRLLLLSQWSSGELRLAHCQKGSSLTRLASPSFKISAHIENPQVLTPTFVLHSLLNSNKQLTAFSMFLAITRYWEVPGVARKSAHFCLNVIEPGYIFPGRQQFCNFD